MMREDDMTDEELMNIIEPRMSASGPIEDRIVNAQQRIQKSSSEITGTLNYRANEISKISENGKGVARPVPVFIPARATKDFFGGITHDTTDYSLIGWTAEYSRSWQIDFVEPNALKNVKNGALVQFHDEETIAIVKNLAGAELREWKDFSHWVLTTTVSSTVIWGAFTLPNLFAAFNLVTTGIAALGIILVTVLASILMWSLFFCAKTEISNKKMQKALTTKKDEELFFFEHDSLALEMLQRSESFLKLVKNKVVSYPTSDELDSWCREVDELLKVQEDFPKDMIPAMSEDVAELRGVLTARVAELEAEKSELLAIEQESITYGTDMIRAGAVEDSKATLAGALNFVQSISMNDRRR